jgi:glycosyltransferase involved in cell wall biosynthesis
MSFASGVTPDGHRFNREATAAMNILHVESSLNWGGQEYRTLEETRWLNAAGHSAWIACNPESELRRRAPAECIPVPLRSSIDLPAAARIRRLCQERGIDVVHVHSPKDAWICYPLHLARYPVVRSRQITNPVGRKWSRSFVYRHGCARVVAAAECIRAELIRRNGVAGERVVVVGEGVDLGAFHPGRDGAAFRAEHAVPADAILFGIVAMIRPEKGHAVFVAAAKKLLSSLSRVRFAIVGEGTGRRELELILRRELRESYGSIARGPIFMTGYRSDTPAVMSALDVLVVPSTAEAQSLVVPQAFASQRAVIASNVGGLPELVRHEETGLLVPPGDPGALAGAMRRLVDDSSLRWRLATNGLRFAREHLNFDRKMRQTIAIYEQVARAPTSRRRPLRPNAPGILLSVRQAVPRPRVRRRRLVVAVAVLLFCFGLVSPNSVLRRIQAGLRIMDATVWVGTRQTQESPWQPMYHRHEDDEHAFVVLPSDDDDVLT